MKILLNLCIVFIVEEVIWFDLISNLKKLHFHDSSINRLFDQLYFKCLLDKLKSNKDTALTNVDKNGKCVVM